MAQVVDVLDDLSGLPVTSGVVGVLEFRQCPPGDFFGRLHHPLESPAVAGSAVAMPGGDTARQNVFNCASVKVCEGLRGQAEFPQPAELRCCALFTTLSVWMDHFRLSVMCTPRN